MSEKKVWFITGAGRGLGVDIAKAALAAGHAVVATARNAETITQAIGEHADLLAVDLDVTDEAAARAAVAVTVERFGRLDVLVNNAGVYHDKKHTILTAPRELFVSTLNTNTFGPIEVVQQFLPALRKSDDARIINMSSGYGQLSDLSPDVSSYCLSKLALNGATIMLAKALAGDGIAVNSVCPGWVRTDMGGGEAPRSVDEGADTAVWLATEADASLTGRFFRDRAEISW
jgi:NAD(P)-dependent dehydrogenase (short-subunit alcohol dehydrogenase family)